MPACRQVSCRRLDLGNLALTHPTCQPRTSAATDESRWLSMSVAESCLNGDFCPTAIGISRGVAEDVRCAGVQRLRLTRLWLACLVRGHVEGTGRGIAESSGLLPVPETPVVAPTEAKDFPARLRQERWSHMLRSTAARTTPIDPEPAPQ